MPRGSTAKINIEKKIKESFGSDYIGNIGGKIYVWANDGNERVQIAIAMTCPKTNVDAPTEIEIKKPAASKSTPAAWDRAPWETPANDEAPWEEPHKNDISQSELDNIERLKKILNL